MKEFVITTDNTADMPKEYYREHQVEYLYLPCRIDNTTYDKSNEMPDAEFYAAMRAGSMPTTSQVNPTDAKAAFAKIIGEGKDILHIAFSSGLSGSAHSAWMAQEELKEEMPEGRIIVIDSLAASMGEGLLLYKAVEMKEAGKSIDEIADWIEANKLHVCHVFTVDDLNHLHRGGRVSKAAAVLGTMINIKPMLHVDNEGHLIPVSKQRGRKKSLHSLVEMMEERIGSYQSEDAVVFISHGDCLEDAQYVAKLVEEKLGMKTTMIHYVGATIGAHAGPGTIALFFMGEYR